MFYWDGVESPSDPGNPELHIRRNFKENYDNFSYFSKKTEVGRPFI